MAPRVEDRKNPTTCATALCQRRTLQKSTSIHKMLGKSKVAKTLLSQGNANQHDSSDRVSSVEEKKLRQIIHNLGCQLKERPHPYLEHLVKQLMFDFQQVKLANKLLKLTMEHVKQQDYVVGPMTREDELEWSMGWHEKFEALSKVPLSLSMLLSKKLKEQFGQPFDMMVSKLQGDIWVEIVKAQQQNDVDKTMSANSVASLTEEDVLRRLVQEFGLAIPVASLTAEDILTEVVRKCASAYPAAKEETLSEHMHGISLSK